MLQGLLVLMMMQGLLLMMMHSLLLQLLLPPCTRLLLLLPVLQLLRRLRRQTCPFRQLLPRCPWGAVQALPTAPLVTRL